MPSDMIVVGLGDLLPGEVEQAEANWVLVVEGASARGRRLAQASCRSLGEKGFVTLRIAQMLPGPVLQSEERSLVLRTEALPEPAIGRWLGSLVLHLERSRRRTKQLPDPIGRAVRTVVGIALEAIGAVRKVYQGRLEYLKIRGRVDFEVPPPVEIQYSDDVALTTAWHLARRWPDATLRDLRRSRS